MKPVNKKNEIVPLPSGSDYLAKPGKMPKMKVLSLPPIIKPAEVPLGASLVGTLLDVKESPKKEIKSRLLTFETITEPKHRFAFPETANIKQSFLAEGGAEKLIGRVICLTSKGRALKGSDGKRPAWLFEVSVSEK